MKTKSRNEKIKKVKNIERRSYLVSEKYKKLKEKSVAIIGVGGTGNITANLLARAGIGKLILIDRDIVEESNLERQILFDFCDIGKAKAKAAENKLKKYCNVLSYSSDLNYKNIESFKLNKCDLIIDCTDNFKTRFLINEYCKKNKINWIYSAAIKNIGSIFFNNSKKSTEICINCFLKGKSGETCAVSGVTNYCVSFLASVCSFTAANYLCFGKIERDLLHINLETYEISKIKVKKDKNCRACNENYEYLNGEKTENLKVLCGGKTFSFLIKNQIKLNEIKKRLKGNSKSISLGNVLTLNNISIFPDKRVLIRASDEKTAKKIFNDFIGY